jgi:DNA-directed RNA polymerase subunit H (RpoH/RPB5)
MDIRSIEYTIYKNLFKYIDIIGFVPVINNSDSNDMIIIKEKKDLIKTLQFYSYVKIKAVCKKNKKDIMYIFLISDNSIVSKSIEFKQLLNTIPENEIQLVIVSRYGIKTVVKKFLSKYSKKKLLIKNLLYNHFKIDIRTNIMVPLHILCTLDETKQIMIDNNIEFLTQFPKIKSIDPQVLWVGGRSGQLMKIIRRDVTGEVLYYRIII